MINILRILIAFICMLITVSAVKAKEINQDAKASVSNSAKDKLDKKVKIFKFIKLVQPKYTDSYIQKIVDAIFKYGKKYNVEPYIIASTAYVESEFSMKSRPCVGIMQLLRSSMKWLNPSKEYDPYTIDGNIALGTKELSMHIHRNVNRGNLIDRSSSNDRTLRYMWGRYNGAGSRSYYSTKTLKVMHTLVSKDLDEIKVRLKKGPIWR
jgi:hypothetical protein